MLESHNMEGPYTSRSKDTRKCNFHSIFSLLVVDIKAAINVNTIPGVSEQPVCGKTEINC